jgi:CHAT domain-containing protein
MPAMSPSPDDPASEVQAALDLAQRAPGDAAALARRILDSDPDPITSASARWALGLATREMGRLDQARSHLVAAVAEAANAGDTRLAANIRSTLAFTLALLGFNQEALREMDHADPHLRGVDAARLRMQRALVLQRMGRADDALDWYRRALPGLRRSGDRIAEVRLRVNRSALHTYRNELAAATADLEAAIAIARETGQVMQVGACAHNLGFVRGREGNIPDALEWYDQAAQAYADAGITGGLAAVLVADRAELLLEAGLTGEARQLALQAADSLRADGNAADLAEARLLAARASLADGDPARARELADLAARSFRAQRRGRWATLARYVEIQAAFELADAGEGPSEELLKRARAATRALAGAGWATESLHAATMAARVALGLGRARSARAILAAAERARRRGSAAARAQAWHATALLRIADDDLRGARRAVEAGMRVVDDHRTGLGATELQANAAVLGEDLAELGARLAISHGDPATVLDWVDRFRAVTMHRPSVRPPQSAELTRLLAELRMLSRDAAEAILHGASLQQAQARRATIENRVRELARHQGGASESSTSSRRLAGLSEALGASTLIEYFTAKGGSLGAVVVTPRGSSIHQLGSVSDVAPMTDMARFDLHRLAGGQGSAMSLDAAMAGLTDTGARLGDALIAPLPIDGCDIVIVPTGSLHGVPWGVIPALTARPVTIATSASAWLQRRQADRRVDGAVFAAGPDLPGGRAEVELLAKRNGASRLTGRNATARKVLVAIESAGVVHLAAHGTFRPDNPMFSSLRLADGPLTVYDLESLRRVPHLFVLPACDAAVSGVRAGDELLGLAAALLRLGASTLVAPLVPVPDTATRDLMVGFHARLAAGDDPASALATAGSQLDDSDPQSHAVRRSFVVLGSS